METGAAPTVSRAASRTPSSSTPTLSTAGTAAQANTERRLKPHQSRAVAISGPVMAPAWSMAR